MYKKLSEDNRLLIESLKSTIQTLENTIKNQNETIENLNQTIKELREQQNKNSKNSSKPPSSDGYKKPSPKSLRKSTGKKVGGQDGHKGYNLTLPENTEITEYIQYMPTKCQGCKHYNKCLGKACIGEVRHTLDISISLNAVEHQQLNIQNCKLDNSTLKGDFPKLVPAKIQYGTNLQALAVSLNTVGAVSLKRTHEILSGVFGVPITPSTINNMVNRCAGKLNETLDKIKQNLINSDVVHFDETGTRVNGKTNWVHSASNNEYTYLTINSKRGKEGINDCGVLPELNGVAVHDCWSPYFSYENVQHSICCAHLLRELIGVYENDERQVWANDFVSLLIDMKDTKNKNISKNKSSLSDYHKNKFNQKYDSLIELAKQLNQLPLPSNTQNKRGRQTKGKILSLVDRLEKHKASVCLFINNFNVPFDNNQAERDIRIIKVKTKVSGCFRSGVGSKNYLKIMSYIGTARKRGFNAFHSIKNAFLDSPNFIF